MTDWQKIETAPLFKQERAFIVYGQIHEGGEWSAPHPFVTDHLFIEGSHFYFERAEDGLATECIPTHWMPGP